ncbi:MAG: NTP transferase domain-containing protein, partial [Burkholderiaceae bacterium]
MMSDQVTGLILAGGRGSRMGGVDKGLERFQGEPMAVRAMVRLMPQVGDVVINANRNIGVYDSFGVTVLMDAIEGYQGPLAGMLAGLSYAETPYLQAVP